MSSFHQDKDNADNKLQVSKALGEAKQRSLFRASCQAQKRKAINLSLIDNQLRNLKIQT